MKKQLLIIGFIFVSYFQSFSQDSLANMFEMGNRWSRSTYTEWMSEPNRIVEEVIADTVIKGLPFAKLRVVLYPFLSHKTPRTSYQFKGQKHNTVHYYDQKGDSIAKLYSFSGLNIGDSLTIFENNYQDLVPQEHAPYKIDSIDFIKLDKENIKRFRLSFNDTTVTSSSGKDTTIIRTKSMYFYDGIGSEGAGTDFAPAYFFESIQALTCIVRANKVYIHDWQGDHDFNLDSEGGCELLTYLRDKPFTLQITLSQSIENQLQVHTEASLQNVQVNIYDTKGTEFQCNLKGNTIDVSSLKNGLYILKIQTQDHQQASFKFMK